MGWLNQTNCMTVNVICKLTNFVLNPTTIS